MFQYKLVKIKLSKWNNMPKEDYHEIIANHAKDGWKFIQLFAPVTSGYGVATYFEIIFERIPNGLKTMNQSVK
jgi:Zn-dependent peptidase ImmA (M78 family)